MTREISDAALLRDYVSRRDENAFAQLMRRHLPMVYSTAARKLGHDRPAAEDVAQAVFVLLASRSPDLLRHPTLAGWLHVAASRKAAEHVRHLSRRQRRENVPQPDVPTPLAPEAAWSEIKPFLDDAILELSEADRHALILHYFEGQEFVGLGQNLGVSADAARMRVTRGVEKLRALLKKRGITSSAVAFEALLLRANAEAVPAGLALSIARAVRTLPTPTASASLVTSVAKLCSAAALLLLVTAIGTAAYRWWQPPPLVGPLQPPARGKVLAGAKSAAGSFLRGRARVRAEGVPRDPSVTQALEYLRSALFDTTLGRQERFRLMVLSSQLLVGWEGEAIPLFREALASTDPEVVLLAVNGLGSFGPLPREFGPELLAALENPQLSEEAGLVANRLLPSMLIADSPVSTLLAVLERHPDLGSPLTYLLSSVLGADKAHLAANREMVETLLNHSEPQIQEVAKAVLAEAPQLPPQPTPEVSGRLTSLLASVDESERRKALFETMQLPSANPEIRQALVTVLQGDSSLQLRLDAAIELERLIPGDPLLAARPAWERENAARDLLSRFERQEVSVPEMLLAVADGSADSSLIINRLPGVDSNYWATHQADKNLANSMLASLLRKPDAGLYEAASDAYAQMNRLPRMAYTLAELAPYFATMESALTPGEYAVAMRDLKPSLEQYWQARQFNRSEPTHLPTQLVQILLVGPYHENRPAYDQMLRTMQQIDPSFQPPTP